MAAQRRMESWLSVLLLLSALATAAKAQSCVGGYVSPSIVIPLPAVGPGASDPVLLALLRATGPLQAASLYPAQITHVLTASWIAAYEGLVPYANYSGLVIGQSLKRPAAEWTPVNKRWSVYYTMYYTMIGTYGPECLKVAYDTVFANASLPAPGVPVPDPSSPINVAKAVSEKLIFYLKNDGWNQDGSALNKYNRFPFSDYTNFTPLNTVNKLTFPLRWQPLRVGIAYGVTLTQEYSGAQSADGILFSYRSPKDLNFPPPSVRRFPSLCYKQQADEVLRLSAELNDTTKAIAEFADCPACYLGAVNFMVNKTGLTFEQHSALLGLLAVAVKDYAITSFWLKRLFDTVRPTSAIRYSGIYAKQTTRAWGGPFQGTVTMNASDWKQYLRMVAPEPEYPSGAAALASVLASSLTNFFNTTELGWFPAMKAGTSFVEPGATPSTDVTFPFPKFADLAQLVAYGRQTGGVHFKEAAEKGIFMGELVAARAWTFFKGLGHGPLY